MGAVAGTENIEAFGHSFYRTPVHDNFMRLKTGHFNNREKNKSFVDKIAMNLQYIPGPKYVKLPQWPEQRKPDQYGAFLKGPRTTFTESIMKAEKNTPAPNKYDNKEELKKLDKILGNYTL